MNSTSPAPAVGGSAGTSLPESSPGVDDLVSQRFRDAMELPVPVQGPSPVSSTHERARTGATTLGDGILSAISQATQSLSTAWDRVKEGPAGVSDTGDLPSLPDLLAFQGQVLMFSTQSEIVSKGVSKATQDLDQLLKQQ